MFRMNIVTAFILIFSVFETTTVFSRPRELLIVSQISATLQFLMLDSTHCSIEDNLTCSIEKELQETPYDFCMVIFSAKF